MPTNSGVCPLPGLLRPRPARGCQAEQEAARADTNNQSTDAKRKMAAVRSAFSVDVARHSHIKRGTGLEAVTFIRSAEQEQRLALLRLCSHSLCVRTQPGGDVLEVPWTIIKC